MGLQEEALAVHNEYRAKHSAPALIWSSECAAAAQRQADQCQAQNELHHGNCEGPSGDHGQNAYMSSGQANVRDATEAFYECVRTLLRMYLP